MGSSCSWLRVLSKETFWDRFISLRNCVWLSDVSMLMLTTGQDWLKGEQRHPFFAQGGLIIDGSSLYELGRC